LLSDEFITPQNTPKSMSVGALFQPPVGSLQRSPDPLAGFKETAFQQEGRGAEGDNKGEGRQRGREGKKSGGQKNGGGKKGVGNGEGGTAPSLLGGGG